MKISFLVIFYNQERYVKQSMDSILAVEKPAEWELIVGDDGSSDGTVDLVNEYVRRDPEHIRLYVMPREAGKRYDAVKRMGANRLNILEHCSGDCFCAPDGDDFYIDTKFVLEAIDVLEKHDDVSVVSFGYKVFRDGQFEKEMLLPAGVGPYIGAERYIKNYYLHGATGVHRLRWKENRMEYLKKIGYFEDEAIMMNSLNDGSMYYINRSVYAYRKTDESTMASLTRNPVVEGALYIRQYYVQKLLIDQSRLLTERYAGKILRIYIWRNKIQSAWGDSMYRQYVEEAKKMDKAISYKLLAYGSLDKKEKKEMRKFALHLFLLGIRKKTRGMFSKYKQDT